MAIPWVLPSVRQEAVGTPDNKVFEAQYPVRTSPCQRFGRALTDAAA